MTDPQATNLKRVTAVIDRHVLRFCRERWNQPPPRFHMDELQTFIRSQVGVAPDSPGRILRSLRQRKLIDYVVVSRRASLYELTKEPAVAVNGTTANGGPS